MITRTNIPYFCKMQNRDGSHVRKSFCINNETQLHIYQEVNSASQTMRTDDLVITKTEAKFLIKELEKFLKRN